SPASSSSERAIRDRAAASTIDSGPRRTVHAVSPDADMVTAESTSPASSAPDGDDGCVAPETEPVDTAEAPPVVSYAGQATLLSPASSTTTTDPCPSPTSTTTTTMAAPTTTTSTTTTVP